MDQKLQVTRKKLKRNLLLLNQLRQLAVEAKEAELSALRARAAAAADRKSTRKEAAVAVENCAEKTQSSGECSHRGAHVGSVSRYAGTADAQPSDRLAEDRRCPWSESRPRAECLGAAENSAPQRGLPLTGEIAPDLSVALFSVKCEVFKIPVKVGLPHDISRQLYHGCSMSSSEFVTQC